MGDLARGRGVHGRSVVELEPCALLAGLPDGRWRRIALRGAEFSVGDAAYAQRFVRHLRIEARGSAADIITPPEQGSIAPRAAGLPVVAEGAVIVDTRTWETITDWVQGEGRLSGRTVPELARLARVATSMFAVTIGEKVAQLMAELSWQKLGPMRSPFGGDIWRLLRPLEDAAVDSERAGEALVAALSRCALATRAV